MRNQTKEALRRSAALRDADTSFLAYGPDDFISNPGDCGCLEKSKVVVIKPKGMATVYAVAVQTRTGGQVSDDVAEDIALDLAYGLELVSEPEEQLDFEVL